MPGSPFSKPYRSSGRKASAKRPQTPKVRKSNVPKATSPVGTVGKSVGNGMRAPRTRVTTKGKHSLPATPVRTGPQLGTPGRHG